jgi:two-component system chemotaxis response regulator CheB
MYPRDIIVIGTSAGGVEALKRLTADLPADLAASVFVVQHCSPRWPSRLAEILDRSGPLRAKNPMNHEAIGHGWIYVAPPDRHLLIQDGHVFTSQGPKENRSRPSVDALFRSAARAYGERVIGVILTGMLDDGTAGLLAIKQQGGVAVVQNPFDAAFPGMPQSALRYVKTNYCLPICEIGAKLVQLSKDPAVAHRPNVSGKLEVEYRISLGDTTAMEQIMAFGNLSSFTCPECHSVLWEVRDDNFIRFRCRMGHAHTAHSLLTDQQDTIENILDSLHRARREHAELASYVRTEDELSREILIRPAAAESSEDLVRVGVAGVG